MQLNIDSFNELLFSALKDQSPQGRLDLLEKEIEMCALEFCNHMACLCDELVDKGYESELFSQVKNIKTNSEKLMEQADELRRQIEESKNEGE